MAHSTDAPAPAPAVEDPIDREEASLLLAWDRAESSDHGAFHLSSSFWPGCSMMGSDQRSGRGDHLLSSEQSSGPSDRPRRVRRNSTSDNRATPPTGKDCDLGPMGPAQLMRASSCEIPVCMRSIHIAAQQPWVCFHETTDSWAYWGSSCFSHGRGGDIPPTGICACRCIHAAFSTSRKCPCF